MGIGYGDPRHAHKKRQLARRSTGPSYTAAQQKAMAAADKKAKPELQSVPSAAGAGRYTLECLQIMP